LKFNIAIKPLDAPDDWQAPLAKPKRRYLRERQAPGTPSISTEQARRSRADKVGQRMAHWLGMPYAGWHHYLDFAIWLDFRRPDGSLQPLIFPAVWLDSDFEAEWLDSDSEALLQKLQDCVRRKRDGAP